MCWVGGLSPAFAQHFGSLGLTVRPITTGGVRRTAVDIPVIEIRVPVKNLPLSATVHTSTTWVWGGGFKHSSVDTSIGGGLRWQPIRHVAVFAQGHVGTFIFNSYTLLGNVGLDIEIPVGDKRVILGAEYFSRRVRELAGFYDGQWRASGKGIGFRVAFDPGFRPPPRRSPRK